MKAMPHKRRRQETSLIIPINVQPTVVGLSIGEMPVIPLLTSNRPFSVSWGDFATELAAGTHSVPQLRMSGNQEIALATLTDAGSVTIVWREGSL